MNMTPPAAATTTMATMRPNTRPPTCAEVRPWAVAAPSGADEAELRVAVGL